MSAPVVMDSSAMLAIALGERRGDAVMGIIRANPFHCYIHAINAYEVATRLMSDGVDIQEAWEAATLGGVQLVDEIPMDMSLRAVTLKGKHRYLSLGDCHCLAFAEEMGGQLLTTDERLADASKIVKAVHLQ